MNDIKNDEGNAHTVNAFIWGYMFIFTAGI